MTTKATFTSLFCYSYRGTNTTTSCKLNIYIIAAAATINISDYSGSILYLSASPYDFLSNEDLQTMKSGQLNISKIKSQNLGTYLLSMCQFIVECKNNCIKLITQV